MASISFRIYAGLLFSTGFCVAPAETGAQSAADEDAIVEAETPLDGAEAAESDLTGLTGPLSIGDRYVGDIDFFVSPEGAGTVNTARLIELLEGIVSQDVLAALRAQTQTAFISFADASVGGITVAFKASELGISVALSSIARQRSLLRLSGLVDPDPANFDSPARIAAGVQLYVEDEVRHGFTKLGDKLAGRAEGFLTAGGFDGVTLSSALDYRRGADDRYAVEGVTLTKDNFSRALRFQLGSVLPSPVGLQSSIELNGIGISRRYQDIRPFQNIRPSGRQSVVLERRSTVEIYVNGLLVDSITVEPGPLDLDDLPLTRGSNDVRLVIRDGAGNEQIIDRSAFYSPVVLAQGITDFGGWIGVPDSRSYRQRGNLPVFSGYYLQGAERGTFGATLQAARDGVQVGGLATLGLRGGFATADVAIGSGGGDTGAAAAIDSELNFDVREPEDLRVRIRWQARSAYFREPLQLRTDNPEQWAAFSSVSYRLDAATAVNLGAAYSRGRASRADAWTLNAGISRRLGRFQANIYASHSDATDRAAATGVRAAISLPFGAGSRATARYDTLNQRAEAEIARYRLRESRDWSARALIGRQQEITDASLRGSYFGQRFAVSASHDGTFGAGDDPEEQITRLSASTFIGFADGIVGWGRDGIEGFTMVRKHPSLGDHDVTLRRGGEDLYRSDGLGPAVVPIQQRYMEVEEQVAVENLPAGYSLPRVSWRLFPSFASGYKLTIGSAANLSVMGRLLLPSGEPLALAIGTLLAESDEVPDVEFFTSEDGSFFAEGIAAGEYTITVANQPRGQLQVGDAEAGSLVEIGDVAVEGSSQ